MNTDEEIKILSERMKELAKAPDASGNYVVKYGVIFKDDFLAGRLEALAGTMKAAKRKKVIDYKGEILLQGAHDNVDVILLAPK